MSAADLPPTSLIIPSINRPRLLRETVESVLAGDDVPTEIIVIDQSKEPDSELAALGRRGSCDVRYTHIRDPGASRARNAGIEAASHGLLVFTDDDMFVANTWFGALVRALLQAGPNVVVTGQVRPAESGTDGGFVPSTIIDPHPARHRGRSGQDVIYTNNLALYRETLDRIGRFDERLGGGARYPAAEDNDLCHRLLEGGNEIHYVPEAVAYHRAWRTLDAYLPLRWSYGRGQGAFYAKHLDLRDRYMLHRLTSDVWQHAVRVFRRWRQPCGALGEVVYTAGLLSGVAGWLVRHGLRRT